jgi:hypothetical protein
MHWQAFWPTVPAGEWCGEFEAREPEHGTLTNYRQEELT